MRKAKMLIAGLMMMAASVFGILAVNQPALAVECPSGTAREGDDVKNLAECNVEETKGEDSLMGRANIIINVALGVIGVAAVVMIIFGGFFYTTSQGNPANVKKGKDTILYGIIGLVIALLAFAIVNFVLGNVFGNDTSAAGETIALEGSEDKAEGKL